MHRTLLAVLLVSIAASNSLAQDSLEGDWEGKVEFDKQKILQSATSATHRKMLEKSMGQLGQIPLRVTFSKGRKFQVRYIYGGDPTRGVFGGTFLKRNGTITVIYRPGRFGVTPLNSTLILQPDGSLLMENLPAYPTVARVVLRKKIS